MIEPGKERKGCMKHQTISGFNLTNFWSGDWLACISKTLDQRVYDEVVQGMNNQGCTQSTEINT